MATEWHAIPLSPISPIPLTNPPPALISDPVFSGNEKQTKGSHPKKNPSQKRSQSPTVPLPSPHFLNLLTGVPLAREQRQRPPRSPEVRKDSTECERRQR